MGVRTTINLYGFEGSNPNTINKTFTKASNSVIQSDDYTVEKSTLEKGETLTVFDYETAVGFGVDTAFSIAKAPTSTNMRVEYEAGTKPVIRTERGVSLGSTPRCTVVIASNGVGTFTFSDVTFTSVVAGDILWIQGAIEAFSSPFVSANQGLWTILSKNGSVIEAVRQKEADGLVGKNQSAVVLTSGSVRVFSSTGVGVGSYVKLGSLFPDVWQGFHKILRVTPDYVDVAGGVFPSVPSFVVGTSQITFFSKIARALFVNGGNSTFELSINDEGFSKVEPFGFGDSLLYQTRAVTSLVARNLSEDQVVLDVVGVQE